MIPLSIALLSAVALAATPVRTIGQQLNSTVQSHSDGARGAALRAAQRDGDACRGELAELDSEIERDRESDWGASPQPPADRNRASMYQHLREAARILGDNGRFDACRMLAFEIRAMQDYDRLPMRGTNSP